MEGKLIVISGFSGSGKGTVVSHIVDNSDDFCLSISATTRKKRDYEIDGIHYFFKTTEQFEDMIKNNELLEYAKYANNYYGTPKKYVLDKLKEGKNIILEIEQQGGFQIKKLYDKAILIFLTTDSLDTLKNRLDNRGSETIETIKDRFNMALTEASNAEKYDYIIISDTIENTAKRIKEIARDNIKDKNEFDKNLLLVNNIKDEIRRYLK